MRSPGTFTRTPRPIIMSGLTRMRMCEERSGTSS